MAKYKICNRLLDIRLAKGFKFQKDFAEYLEEERQDYNKIENNKRPLTLLKALIYSKKLGVPVDEICYLEEIESSNDE